MKRDQSDLAPGGAQTAGPDGVHPLSFHPRRGEASLAARLARELDAEVLFDPASRGRYATDASFYQIEPIGVVVPRTEEAAAGALALGLSEGVPVLPRGAGTSQCGQTVGAALVIDNAKYLNKLVSLDKEAATCVVQPGMVLDQLNALLKPHGLWFPVDVSTSAQATLGGMAGNNSCGSRSIRYGNMVHNVLGIDALLADGTACHFGPSGDIAAGPARYREIAAAVHAIVAREREEIAARWPTVLRRVQGYNLDMVQPLLDGRANPHNLAHLLVGSEGTLAYSQRLHLKLSPLPKHKTLGICHFASFYESMRAPQFIVELGPAAVELVDRTMLGLARSNPAFLPVLDQCVHGDPDAVLLVEFAGDDREDCVRRLKQLTEMMADCGFTGEGRGKVVEITDATLQRDFWEVRKAGLNIMMSMKGEGKPVSFIEDCAVPLEHLAEYTRQLTEVFHKHGTEGTWYAHASVGTLHVRPILNMKGEGARQMRAIAEEACELVRRYKGAYSGEHGDGLVRSEWIAPILGERLTAALGEVKSLFDPRGLLNPGKIVNPPKQDDARLFRYKPGYASRAPDTALDWSEWNGPTLGSPVPSTGLAAAVEMCNNNGHCRKFDAGTMCPSFRVTRDERDLTRGRANTLRLALSGQLGEAGLASREVHEALDLCVSCKGCKRECPTGVDMAKMKIEATRAWKQRHGWTLRDRAIAHLPRIAPLASRFAPLANLAQGLARGLLGFSSTRTLPRWHAKPYVDTAHGMAEGAVKLDPVRDVVLLVDSFNRWFEPENARAARRVLEAAGYRVHAAASPDGRALCCGRTYLSAGMVDEARAEATRTLRALACYVSSGIAVIGLEPSCLLTLRDEFKSLLPGREAQALSEQALLFEEFLAREQAAGRLKLALKSLPEKRALLHGHCHQKAFGAMPAVESVLRLVPGLEVKTIETSCCGGAGSFGYESEHAEVSRAMAEASLLPAVRAAGADTLLVADGTSCRHQIADGAQRGAVHVAQVLARALG